MDITGKAFISKGNYGFYMTLKDKQTEAKCYLPVSFKKGQEPDDGGEFYINKAFITAFTSKSGEARLKLFVMDYSGNEAQNVAPSGKPYPKTVKFEETAADGDLPF